MRILILGAGRVGESVAETLVSEANDITLIDTDPAHLRKLEERLELRGVPGNGTLPSVLRGAGADDCDLFIAATGHDATNLVACKVAHGVFGIPSTIARLRSSEFGDGELLGKEGFAVDRVICPEESVTRYIQLLIDYPGALQVVRFSQGRRTWRWCGWPPTAPWPATASPSSASSTPTCPCASSPSTATTPSWRARPTRACRRATRSSC
jgi:trk system potassium uptake protein TrkA